MRRDIDKAIKQQIGDVEERILQQYLYSPAKQEQLQKNKKALKVKCKKLQGEVVALQHKIVGQFRHEIALMKNKLDLMKEVERVTKDLSLEKQERLILKRRLKAYQTPVTGKPRDQQA